MNNSDIFKTDFNNLNFEDSNGNTITDDINEYFNKLEQEEITYNVKLMEGDIVQLKGTDYDVIVKYIDYQVPNLGVVDYAGIKTDDINESLILFNQKDIEKIKGKNKVSK